MVLGLFASLFMIPGNVPTWLLAALFGAIIAAMSYVLFARLGKIAGRGSIKDTGLSTVIIVLGLLIFVLDLAFKLARHSR